MDVQGIWPGSCFLSVVTWFLVLTLRKVGGNMEVSYRNDVDDLCERASKEQDPRKFIQIIQRLNEALEERRRRPGRTAPDVIPSAAGDGCYAATDWAS